MQRVAQNLVILSGIATLLLTAEEIGTQNLDGMQLVVLSACDTGLGKSASDEGALGLQRAFQAAGVRSVLTSLWNVPDQATRAVMERFYQNQWKKNQRPLEALREAQLYVMREGTACGFGEAQLHATRADASRGFRRKGDEDKETGKGFSPKYWAGFVLSGHAH